jgi:hypothetical protein
MKRLGTTKILLLIAVTFLVLSVVLSVASLFPVATGNKQKVTIINDSFRLSQNETYRESLGAFHGGENISVTVDCQTASMKNFSIEPANITFYSNLSNQNISFTANSTYYEAVFYSNAPNATWIHLQIAVEKPQALYPLAAFTAPAKIMFLLSSATTMLIILKSLLPKGKQKPEPNPYLPIINKAYRNRLLTLLLISLVFWLVLLALNSYPLATFNNWYTDHARHTYVSSLFLKDGLSVFNQPLGTLANQDSSHFMFVTWPETPHLYPFGSILLFLPFGALMQNGLDPVLVYKFEIALFLVFAHICLYFFLRVFLKKDMHLFWKLVGLYIIYVSLVVYAASGMFDAVAFLFALIAVTMFLNERYDFFFLFMGVSVFLKYQAAIFMLPLIVVGVLRLFERNTVGSLIRNKAVIAGAVLVAISGFTAYLSAPFLMQTRPELILNTVNAFAPHAQIDWLHQSTYVLLTLTVTLVYAAYMLNKNKLLSLSAIFLLLPSFMLPYFQYWYIPFFFVTALIPQKKKELEVTVIWLIFMVAALTGILANPLQFMNVLHSVFKF